LFRAKITTFFWVSVLIDAEVVKEKKVYSSVPKGYKIIFYTLGEVWLFVLNGDIKIKLYQAWLYTVHEQFCDLITSANNINSSLCHHIIGLVLTVILLGVTKFDPSIYFYFYVTRFDPSTTPHIE
jgi:hypothetical protein